MSTPHVGVAVTHKILHHKLPRLAPLLDGRTAPILSRQRVALGCSSNWAVILNDLTRQADQFESLESFQAALAGARRTKPLFRLRIHDTLLWCEAPDNVATHSGSARRSATGAGATGPSHENPVIWLHESRGTAVAVA